MDLVLGSCAKLVGKINFELHIVGDGPLRRQLEQQARSLALTEFVKFHGWLRQSVAAELLRNCDVMVLTSMRECGGAVVLEAMASGLPVIATEWGGPIDYLTKDTGILVPPENPEKFTEIFSEAILALGQNPDLRAEMGRCGRERVRDNFDWGVKASILLELYASIRRDVVE